MQNNKKDLQGLTNIFHIRIDTEERARNLQIVKNYYRQHFVNYKNIFIEDDATPRVLDIIDIEANETYIFKQNTDTYRRCAAFNDGLQFAKSELVSFHDTDVIIPSQQLLTSIDFLLNNKNAGVFYPYNGIFLCVTNDIKTKFATTLDEDIFHKIWPASLAVNFTDENVLVGSTRSVGGYIMGRRDNLLKAKGYNPNFIGWGYEDNELPRRMHTLGYDVSRLSGEKDALWHLPHDGQGAALKDKNPFYTKNRELYEYMSSLNRADLEKFIECNWSL